MELRRSRRWALASLAAAAAFAWLVAEDSGDRRVSGPRAFAAVTPGGAAPNIAAAARVRADIESALALLSLSWPVRTGGDVIVAERDGAFHIVVPGVVVEMRNGGELDIGDIEAVADPRRDRRYDVRVTLPGTMLLRGGVGTKTTQLTIGKQRFEGVWAPAFGTFLQLDAAYRSIRAVTHGGLTTMTLGGVTIGVDYTESSPGSWDGFWVLRLSDLELAENEAAERVKIGSIEVQSQGQDMRLAELVSFTREFNAALQRLDESDSEDALSLALLRMFGAMPRLYASSSIEVTVAGIDVEDSTGARTFGLERADFRFAIKGLDEERSRIEIRYEHDGLDIPAIDRITREFVPRHMVFDAAAVDLPNEALSRALADSSRDAAGAAPDNASAVLFERISAALFEAASEFTINRLSLDAPDVSLVADGAARVDPEAAYGAVGVFDATIRGLDKLPASLAAIAAKQNRDEVMAAAMIVAMVIAAGQPGVDDSGAPTRRYRFELTADGAVLLNGVDMQGLLDGLAGQ